MWKIRIEYDDHSKLTLTGRHKDIPYRIGSPLNIPINTETARTASSVSTSNTRLVNTMQWI